MAAAVEPEPSVEEPEEPTGKKGKPPPVPTASLREMYRYASTYELILMVVGFVAALGGGIAQPMMLFAFLGLLDSLGSGSVLSGALVSNDQMMTVLTTMLWVAFGMGTARVISIPCLEYVNSSLMRKYKQEYLKAVLRQDVSWYDISNPEELSTKFAEAIEVVRKGLKSQSMLFEGLGYGCGALILAFTPGVGNPEVSAIAIGTVPLLVIPAVGAMHFVENGGKMLAKAYAKAGGTATECLFSMRTVMSLGIEASFSKRYASSLSSVRFIKVRNDALLMTFAGCALSAYLVMMAAGVIYGSLQLAAEMERSGFNMTYTDAATGVTMYLCARSDGQPGNLSMTPCKVPFQMTCMMANTLDLVGQTTLQQMYEQQSKCVDKPLCNLFNSCCSREYVSIPDGMGNMTVLESMGYKNISALDTQVQDEAPSGYIGGNPSYYSCRYGGTSVLIAILGIMMMGEGFSMAGQPFAKMQLAQQAAAKILAVINRIPVIDSFSEAGIKLKSVSGTIDVQNVVFAYPSAPEKNVCNDYNLHVPAGQTVALCGPSGAGKSTIIQLLERFYDPMAGVVLLDGVDIKTMNVRWLRAQLGYVGQEPVLFSGSVAENIGFGSPGASQEAIEEAAKMANAHAFIMDNLADGYNTSVGQGGGKLSGGQKQRVAIARAMIKKPKVLLLDEATSALDNESERIVQAALDEIMTKQRRTTIVIAHRLSTIRNADKIAVLDNGAVVEQGTYDELLGTGGLFSTLAKKQEEMLTKDKAAMSGGSTNASGHGGSAAVVEAEVAEVMEVTTTSKGGKKAKKEKKAKEPKEKEESAPIARIFAMQADQSLTLFLMCFFSCAGSAVATYAFYLLAVIMEVMYKIDANALREDAIRIVWQLLIFAGITIGCFFGSGVCNGLAGSSLTAKLRSRGMSAMMRQEMAFFDVDENSAPELTAFLAEKVDKVKTLTTEMLDVVAQVVGGFGAFLLVLALFSTWQLLLAYMAMLTIISIVMPMEQALLTGKTEEEQKKLKGKEDTSKMGMAQKSANNIVGDAVVGIRTVASFNLEHTFYDNFCKTNNAISSFEIRDSFVHAFFGALSLYLMMGLFGLTFWYGIWLANRGLCDVEGVMAPMWAMTGVFPSVMKMSSLADAKVCTKAAIKLFKLIDRVPTIDNLDTTPGEEPEVKGAIELRDVTFAYPTALDHLVCKGYSLVIPAGQTVALCGPSGAGKSTAINLIERFYDPITGMVLLDGVDIKTMNVRWLRAQLGYVGQEPVLFQGTVSENIAHGMPGASQEAIEEAAKMANAHAFIMDNLADGYNTNVGLKGGKLSGGQKQRVAIARAIIKKPKVLLLDEATSALDNESERIVQAALDEIMTKQRRTTIVIAHRLSTIRNADKIAVINEGAVVEQGTHDELLANQNLYTNLVMAAA